jgi:hypothetical protein
MITDVKTNLYQKKILNYANIGAAFLDFLSQKAQDQGKCFVVDEVDGALFKQVTLTAPPATSTLTVTGKIYGTDGVGQIVAADAADATHQPYMQAIPFEDSLAVPYYVAAKRAAVPETPIETNPAIASTFHYGTYREILGDGPYTPDAVTNPGPGLKIVVDVATENGAVVDHTGQTVYVWLVTPESGVYATAVEECTIANDGVNNYVLTAGVFGQTAVSVVAADYLVCVKGLPWKTTSFVGVAEYIALGLVAGSGGGAPTVDLTGQQILYGAGLDLNNVLEVGPNGDLKIAVKAHAADAGVPQVSVIDNAAVRQWHVKEDGDHNWIGGSIMGEDAAEAYFTGTPGVGYGRFGTPNTKKHDIDVDLIAAGYATGITQGGETNFATFRGNKTSWLGNIAEGQKVRETLNFGACAVPPALSVGGAGLDLDFGAYEVMTEGAYEHVGAGTLTIVWGVSQTWYAYFDRTTNTTAATQVAGDIDLDGGDIILAIFTSDPGQQINNIFDTAQTLKWMERKIPLIVGENHGTFPTIFQAVQFVRAMRLLLKETTWNMEIVVAEDTTETVPIVLDQNCEGIRINGAIRDRAQHQVTYDSNNGSLFELNTVSDVEIGHLNFAYDATKAPAGYDGAVVNLAAGTTALRINIHDCYTAVNGTHSFTHFIYANTGTLTQLSVSNCHAQTTDGFANLELTVGGKIIFKECFCDQQGVIVGAQAHGFHLENTDNAMLWNCWTSSVFGAGVSLASCSAIKIIGGSVTTSGGGIDGQVAKPSDDVLIQDVHFDTNTIRDVSGEGDNWRVIGCSAASGTGQGIEFNSGTLALAAYNDFQALGAAISGIQTQVPETRIIGNKLSGTGAATDHAIHFSTGAVDGYCEGNTVNTWGTGSCVYIDGTALYCTVKGNQLDSDDTTRYVIDINAGGAAIIGNTIKNSFFGIDIGSVNCRVIGNYLALDHGAGEIGIRIGANSNVVSNNHIFDCDYGIQINGSYNVVTGNHTNLALWGIVQTTHTHQGNVVCDNNIFAYGSVANEDGIYIAGDFNSVCNNSINGITAGAGVPLRIAAATAVKNTVCGNTSSDGVAMVDAGTGTLPAGIAGFNTW